METLRLGSSGPYVDLLQSALRRAGYLGAPPDGMFGPRTDAAVRAFQTAMGLAADGIVGPATQLALRPYYTGYLRRAIRPGDTYTALAARFGTTVRAISAANPTLDPNRLPVGAPITIPLWFPVTFEDVRYTHRAVQYVAEGLTARYPFIRAGSVGRSVEGQELTLLSIGEGPKEVLYHASHHANEWITTPTVLKFLEQLAAGRALGTPVGNFTAAQILRGTTIHFVPLVNPDGVDLVTGAYPPGSRQYEAAKTMNERYGLRFPSGWKANIRGTDLNLNYPAGWEEARRIKYAQGFTAPGPRDFVGPAPLSEPESQAMAAFTRARNLALTLSYHAQGEIIYWRYLDYLPPQSEEIGRAMSEASGYALELTPDESGHAGYKDWFILTYNRPGYTIEVGRGVSPLPLSQFPRIYRDNVPIMALGAIMA